MDWARRAVASFAISTAALLVVIPHAMAECPGGVPVTGPGEEVLCEPDPSPTPTETPSPTPTPTPTNTPTPTPTPTPTKSPSKSPKPTPSESGAPFSPSPPPGFDPDNRVDPNEFAEDLARQRQDFTSAFEQEHGNSGAYSVMTGRGLALVPGQTGSSSPATRVVILLAGAMTLTALLFSSRVRSWMIGI